MPDRMPDGLSWPRICIVTPSYNQGQFIEETIRSVLLQGYPDLEYIVMDGGSTDNTVEVIRKYEPWLSYWVSESDRGQAAAINKGWRLATGEILGWLNSDDCYFLSAFQKVANAFIRDENIRVLAGEGILINTDGKQIAAKPAYSFDPVALLVHSQPLQPTTFYRKSVLSEVGFLNENLHYAMDREFFLRLGNHYFPEKTISIEYPLAYSTEWPGMKSATGTSRAMQERRSVIAKFLADPTIPNEWCLLKRRAFRHSFLLDAIWQARAGRLNRIVLSLLKALYYSRNWREYKQILGHFRLLSTRMQ
ncbi:glycosyltransferase family 2 protein [Thermodesulfobacteriota bacterium]